MQKIKNIFIRPETLLIWKPLARQSTHLIKSLIICGYKCIFGIRIEILGIIKYTKYIEVI